MILTVDLVENVLSVRLCNPPIWRKKILGMR